MKRAWWLLAAAIIFEVGGTLSLRATVDSIGWIPVVAVCYIVAFSFIGLALRRGMSVGVAYGIWGACGVGLVALFGALIFDETLSPQVLLGIVIVIAGVVLIETGSHERLQNASEEVAS